MPGMFASAGLLRSEERKLLIRVYRINWIKKNEADLLISLIFYLFMEFSDRYGFDLINRRYQCFDYSTLEIWGIHFVISLGVAIVSCYFLEPMLNRVFHKMTEKYL